MKGKGGLWDGQGKEEGEEGREEGEERIGRRERGANGMEGKLGIFCAYEARSAHRSKKGCGRRGAGGGGKGLEGERPTFCVQPLFYNDF